jgi:hypothetical protein
MADDARPCVGDTPTVALVAAADGAGEPANRANPMMNATPTEAATLRAGAASERLRGDRPARAGFRSDTEDEPERTPNSSLPPDLCQLP